MFKYPFSNTEELNLDWFIESWKTFAENYEEQIGQLDLEILARLLANKYDPESDYSVGNYVVYDNYLWRNVVSITGGESWNANHWLQVLATDDLEAARSAITALQAAVNGMTTDDVINASDVDGDSATEALNELKSALTSLGSDDIANDSSDVSGSTVTDAVDALKSAIKKNYILLGDSFAIGYTTDDGQTYSENANGWEHYAKTILTAQGHTVYTTSDIETSISGNTGFASSKPFLTLLQNIELLVDNPNTITDIIVLGGTNDIDYSANVETAITNFVAYANEHFPNAFIKIGCLSTRMGDVYNSIRPHYRIINELGGEYIDDLIFLLCNYNYYCYDNLHLTASGYAYYRGYILQAILTGHVEYMQEITYTLTKANEDFTASAEPTSFSIQYTPHAIKAIFNATAGMYIKYSSALSPSLKPLYTITPSLRLPTYYTKIGQALIFGTVSNGSTHIKGAGYTYLTATAYCFYQGLVNTADTTTVDEYDVLLNQSAVVQLL